MSYTLRGRVESRVAVVLLVLAGAIAVALVEHRWWPVEAVGLMLGVGLALDTLVYDRMLRYQPAWVALPLRRQFAAQRPPAPDRKGKIRRLPGPLLLQRSGRELLNQIR